MELLKTISLRCGYGRKAVLSDIDLEVGTGELVAVVGLNGSGKSTLLRTIAGLQEPLNGTVSFAGTGLDQMGKGRSRHIGVVLTQPPRVAHMTVWEMVALGRYPHTGPMGRLSAEDEQVIVNAMERLAIIEFGDRPLSELSDGERQRVMIARVLAQDTELIIMDEPTAHLDALNRVTTLKTMKDLVAGMDRSIVFSSHDLSLALQVAHKVWVVHEGAVVAGNTEELIKSELFSSVYNTESVTFNSENYQLNIK